MLGLPLERFMRLSDRTCATVRLCSLLSGEIAELAACGPIALNFPRLTERQVDSVAEL